MAKEYKIAVVINNGPKPYRSCTIPDMYGPTAQPIFHDRFKILFTKPCWCSGVCSMQKAEYSGEDMFINAVRKRKAIDEIHRSGEKPINSRKTKLPNWVVTTALTFPPRRVESRGARMLPTPINNEDRLKSKPNSESLISNLSLKNTFIYGIRIAAPKPISTWGISILTVRAVSVDAGFFNGNPAETPG